MFQPKFVAGSRSLYRNSPKLLKAWERLSACDVRNHGGGHPQENVMKALCWHGKSDIRCETVPDPQIQDAGDVVIKVTACAICGSDLHV